MDEKRTPVPPPPSNVPEVPKPKRYISKTEAEALERGFSPPNAIELEQVLLGALLIDNKALDEIMPICKAMFFYNEDHRVIFSAIETLYENGQPVDLLTVSNELKRISMLGHIGGDFYLISLTQRVSSSAHSEFHARIIIQKYVLREFIKLSRWVTEKSYENDNDIFDIMDKIESTLARIHKEAIKGSSATYADAKLELREKVRLVQSGETPGVYTGLEEFDNWCGGFQRRELITVAARPGMGKTTAMLAIADNASKKGTKIALFSLEMAVADLKARLASKNIGLPYTNIRQGRITEKQLIEIEAYYDRIDQSNLTLVDKITKHDQIVKRIRELVVQKGVRMIMIDYVQLINLHGGRSNDRTSELSSITRELKALANELNVPIIIIAQVSRAVDNRQNKRPILSDLKQSGSIEEDSDTVIFLYRDAYYQQELGAQLPPHIIGKTEFNVAKGRNTGTRNFLTYLDFYKYDFRSYA